MTAPWRERLEADPVAGQLAELSSILDRRFKWPEDSQGPALMSSIKLVVDDVRGRIELSDPALITPSMLGALHQPTAQLAEVLDRFHEEPTEPLLVAALPHVDQLLDQAANLPDNPWGDSIDPARSAVRRFRDAAARERRDLEAHALTVNRRVDELDTTLADRAATAERRLDELGATVDSRATELETKIVQSTESLGAKLDELERQRAALESQVAEDARIATERFDGAFDQTSQRFNEALPEWEREAREARAEVEAAWGEHMQSVREESAEHLETLTGLEEQARQVLGVSARRLWLRPT